METNQKQTGKEKEAVMRRFSFLVVCFLSLSLLTVGLSTGYADDDSDVPEEVQARRDTWDERWQDVFDSIDSGEEEMRQRTTDVLDEALANGEISQERYDSLMGFWEGAWEKRDQNKEQRRETLDELVTQFREAQDERAETRQTRREEIQTKREERREAIESGEAPAKATADWKEDSVDRAEDVRDRREDIYDTTHNYPVGTEAWRRDRAEDRRDKAEDRRDRAEDIQDRGAAPDRQAGKTIATDTAVGSRRAADRREDIRDRREDTRDRREDRWDATHNAPVGTEAWKKDKAEDRRDRTEDRRDRAEDRKDRGAAPDRKGKAGGNRGIFKGGDVSSDASSGNISNKAKNINKPAVSVANSNVKKYEKKAIKKDIGGSKRDVSKSSSVGGSKIRRK